MLYHSTRLNEFRFSLGHLTPRLKQVTTKAHLVVQAPPRSSAAAFLLSFGIGQSHKYLQEWCTPTPHKLFRSHVLRFNDVTVHFLVVFSISRSYFAWQRPRRQGSSAAIRFL